MILNNRAVAVLGAGPDSQQWSHQINGDAQNVSDNNATNASDSITDQIALSLASKLIQPALNADAEVQLERILQLRTAILNEQYSYDPLLMSRALIEALQQGW